MIYLEHFKFNTEKQKAKCFCRNPKAIENYGFAISDGKHMWECHHKLETHFSDETERPRNAQITQAELIALGMYYDRPPEELIFLTKSEHRSLHSSTLGMKWNEDQKKRHGEILKGKTGGDTCSNKRWFTNGFINVREEKCPPYFRPGRVGLPKGRKCSEETRKKLSVSLKGRKPTFLGKHHSEETKRKISETKKKNQNPGILL